MVPPAGGIGGATSGAVSTLSCDQGDAEDRSRPTQSTDRLNLQARSILGAQLFRDAQISLVNVFALQVMGPMAARACPMLGGSADSQRRQASILMTRAANDSLIWGATVVDRLDSLTGWDPWKTGDPSCRPLSGTNWSSFSSSTSANELLQ